MDFIKSELLPTEKLTYFSHPHWIIFAPATILLAIALSILIIGPDYAFASLQISTWPLYKMMAGIFAAVGVYWFLSAIVTYLTAEYGVTTKRVIMKTGWIRRDTREIFLDKVEAVNVDQSILGRILDYGTLIIIGTGSTQDVYYTVPKPFLYRRATQMQVDTEIHHQR